jgi:hypothetical protein
MGDALSVMRPIEGSRSYFLRDRVQFDSIPNLYKG